MRKPRLAVLQVTFLLASLLSNECVEQTGIWGPVRFPLVLSGRVVHGRLPELNSPCMFGCPSRDYSGCFQITQDCGYFAGQSCPNRGWVDFLVLFIEWPDTHPLVEPRAGSPGTWAEKDGRSPFQRCCCGGKKTVAKSKDRRAWSESI